MKKSQKDLKREKLKKEVKKLFLEGKTYTEIATKLNSTRNSVAGIVHRLRKSKEITLKIKQSGRFSNLDPKKIKNKKKPLEKKTSLSEEKVKKLQPKQEIKMEPEKNEDGTVGLNLEFIDVIGAMCRFPLKETTRGSFLWCGHPTEDVTHSYCPYHEGVCHSNSKGKSEETMIKGIQFSEQRKESENHV